MAEDERADIAAIEAEPPSENVELASVSIPSEEASGVAEQIAPQSPLSNAPVAPENRDSQPMAESERADIAAIEAEPPSENGELDPVSIPPEEASGVAEQVAPQSPISNALIAPENHDSQPMAEDERADVAAIEAEPPSENAELDPVSIPPEEASGIAEPITPFEPDAEPAAQSQPDVNVTPQSPGVSRMNNSKKAIALGEGGVAVSAEKRVILSMGGKGGVGKTSVMTGLAEWFEENRIPVTLLDLDTENKSRGSFTHFFGGSVPKINIHTPAGLDAFVDHLADVAPVILGDMGAGAGKITHDWFEKMYPDVAELGIVFTAIGVVTSDPASVESVLDWAAALEDRVAYVIVENNLTEHTDFTYWQESSQAEEFRKRFQPAIVRLDYRLADLENAVRNYGVTLGQVAGRTTPHAELQKASLVMRAQSYRRRMFAEFEKVKELLLP
jgi:Mrp family chromosome partitioning ATPase